MARLSWRSCSPSARLSGTRQSDLAGRSGADRRSGRSGLGEAQHARQMIRDSAATCRTQRFPSASNCFSRVFSAARSFSAWRRRPFSPPPEVAGSPADVQMLGDLGDLAALGHQPVSSLQLADDPLRGMGGIASSKPSCLSGGRTHISWTNLGSDHALRHTATTIARVSHALHSRRGHEAE